MSLDLVLRLRCMERVVRARIESMAFGGYGVARIEGKVVFIPNSVTGDEGRVEMVEEKKSYSVGRWVEILLPSPWRVAPPCPYFGTCGGCQWQHIDYGQQPELKRQILRDILIRLADLKEIPPIALYPSPDPYDYRTRIQLKVKANRIGYYREKSHQLVDIDRCLISHPLVNEILPLLRQELLLFSLTDEVEIRTSPKEGKGVLVLHARDSSPKWKASLRHFLKSQPILKGITILRRGQTSSLGHSHLYFAIPLNLTLRISPGSFSQVNLKQNERLIQTVLAFSGETRHATALDLYSGVGNLTLPLSSVSQQVLGIDENPAAVKDARFNAQLNGIESVRFLHGRVEAILRKWKGEKPDLVVLDPPRTGAKEVADQVARLRPERIIYVSCEPTRFARDLRLFAKEEYSLRALTLVDMFPQTYHMELVGLLAQS